MTKYYIVNVNEKTAIAGPFNTEVEAEKYAEKQWGRNWYTKGSPYAIWDTMEVFKNRVSLRELFRFDENKTKGD